MTTTRRLPIDADQVHAIFESADGTKQRNASWAVDDYWQRAQNGDWAKYFGARAKVQLEDALGPGFRQVSASLNGEPLMDSLLV